MATAYRGFQLGLLPERKVNKKALATAYGLVAFALLIVINISLIIPEKLQLTQYHVTELIPMPSLRPEPEPIKVTPEVKPKLLAAVKLPVFEQPKLVVPRELRREAPQPVEAPKVVVNQFAAPQTQDRGGRGPSAAGAHRRFQRHRQFAKTHRQRCGGESTDRRLWRSQWLEGNRQAGREAVRGRSGWF